MRASVLSTTASAKTSCLCRYTKVQVFAHMHLSPEIFAEEI